MEDIGKMEKVIAIPKAPVMKSLDLNGEIIQNCDYGIVTFAKIGCKVNCETTLFNIYAKDSTVAEITAQKLLECIEIK